MIHFYTFLCILFFSSTIPFYLYLSISVTALSLFYFPPFFHKLSVSFQFFSLSFFSIIYIFHFLFCLPFSVPLYNISFLSLFLSTSTSLFLYHLRFSMYCIFSLFCISLYICFSFSLFLPSNVLFFLLILFSHSSSCFRFIFTYLFLSLFFLSFYHLSLYILSYMY